MFVLVDKASGGVYAVKDDTTVERVVQLFQEEDDAVRYHEYLIAADYDREGYNYKCKEGIKSFWRTHKSNLSK